MENFNLPNLIVSVQYQVLFTGTVPGIVLFATCVCHGSVRPRRILKDTFVQRTQAVCAGVCS